MNQALRYALTDMHWGWPYLTLLTNIMLSIWIEQGLRKAKQPENIYIQFQREKTPTNHQCWDLRCVVWGWHPVAVHFRIFLNALWWMFLKWNYLVDYHLTPVEAVLKEHFLYSWLLFIVSGSDPPPAPKKHNMTHTLRDFWRIPESSGPNLR